MAPRHQAQQARLQEIIDTTVPLLGHDDGQNEVFWQGIAIQTIGTHIAAFIILLAAVVTGVGYTPAIRAFVLSMTVAVRLFIQVRYACPMPTCDVRGCTSPATDKVPAPGVPGGRLYVCKSDMEKIASGTYTYVVLPEEHKLELRKKS